MDDRLTELTVRDLVERLATADPVPGGGSAAALAGAMGAATLGMVVSLSTGRGANDADEASLTELTTAAAAWQSELLNLVELDANAYAAVVNARRLPRASDAERRARDVQVAAAIREATRAPLQAMRAASAVLDLAARLAPIANPRAISDVGVGAILAAAAVRGAALNVEINLPDVDDDGLRADARAALAEILGSLDERERTVRSLVQGRMA